MDKIFWKSSKQPLSPLPLGIVDIGVLPRCTFSTHYSPNGNDFFWKLATFFSKDGRGIFGNTAGVEVVVVVVEVGVEVVVG